MDQTRSWQRINEALSSKTCLTAKSMPSVTVIDSQSLKGGQPMALNCGYDAGKRIKGRKRNVFPDANGLMLDMVVAAASVPSRDGGKLLLRLGRFSGHGAGSGLGIIKRLEDQKGFIVLPSRWGIERIFGWLLKQRRLTRDHEKPPPAITKPSSISLSSAP